MWRSCKTGETKSKYKYWCNLSCVQMHASVCFVTVVLQSHKPVLWILQYCMGYWYRSTLLNELFRCQKKALRTITLSNFKQHTRPLFVSLKVLPVSQLNDLQVACFIYRCANGMLLARSFCYMYQMNATYHSYHTRTQSAYHYSYCRLNLRKNTVRIYGVRLWNSLDSNLRCTVSLSVFKNNYKEILLRSV